MYTKKQISSSIMTFLYSFLQKRGLKWDFWGAHSANFLKHLNKFVLKPSDCLVIGGLFDNKC